LQNGVGQLNLNADTKLWVEIKPRRRHVGWNLFRVEQR
jgi:hypothetical protein